MKYPIVLLLLLAHCINLLAQQEETPPPTKKEFSHAFGYRIPDVLDQRDLMRDLELAEQILLEGLKAGFEAKKSETDSQYQPEQSWFYGIDTNTDEDSIKKAIFDYGFYEGSHHRHFPHQHAADSLVYQYLADGVKSYFRDFSKNTIDLEKAESIYMAHISAVYKIQSAIREKEEKAAIEQNRLNAQAFLEKNKSKKGVFTTASGLQYEIINKGTGSTPSSTDRVFMHYTSENIKGENLYSTRIDIGEKPISFSIANLKLGWLEAVSLMNKGAVYKFYFPHHVLYGKDAKIYYSSTPLISVVTINLLDIQEDILKTDKDKLSYILGYNYISNSPIIAMVPNADKYAAAYVEGFQKSAVPNMAVLNKLNRMYRSIRVSDYRVKDTTFTDSIVARQWIYYFGYQIGYQASQTGVSLNLLDSDFIQLGFSHAVTNTYSWVDDTEGDSLIIKVTEKGKTTFAEKEATRTKIFKENIAKGNAFLEKNAKNKKIKVLPSGIQYQVLKKGQGASPNMEDVVTIHYTAKLIDGTLIANSAELKEPIPVDISYTLQSWEEILPLMKVGAKYKFYVSAKQENYNNQFQSIPPGSVLIYEMELISIKTK